MRDTALFLRTQHSASTFFANKKVSPLVAEFGDPGLS